MENYIRGKDQYLKSVDNLIDQANNSMSKMDIGNPAVKQQMDTYLALFNNCPYDTSPGWDGSSGYTPFERVAIGIMKETINYKEAGQMVLFGSSADSSAITRVWLQAASIFGDYGRISLHDTAGTTQVILKAGGTYQLSVVGDANIQGTLHGKLDQLDSHRIFIRGIDSGDPASTNTVNNYDLWFDTTMHNIKMRLDNSWVIF